MKGWACGLVAVVLALGGCSLPVGGDGLSDDASAALSDRMGDVRAAVAADEPAAAQQALDALHAEARRRAEVGEISSQRLAAIGTAVDDVERRLGEVGPAPAPGSEAESDPDPDPDPDPGPGEDNPGKGKGNPGKDKGNGNGNGDEADEDAEDEAEEEVEDGEDETEDGDDG